MKKVVLALMVLLAIGGMAFAAPKAKDATPKAAAPKALTPYVDKGEFLVNVGIGWGGISGGAEMTFARIDIGGVIPLTFGASARAFIDPGICYYWSPLTFGVGGFATVHCGFKELGLPSGFGWFSNCDVYVGLGVGFASTSDSYYTGGIGISTFEGASYYLNDNIAINFEYGYIGRVNYSTYYYYSLYYSTIGVVFKL